MFIFSKFILYSFIFFGQIWSQNLKFFKLIEIRYRSRLVYAYFDFKLFFQNFCHSCFWANYVPKSEVLQIN